MFEIIMPKAGMAMETGTIVQWLKDVGDKVAYGDPILEIETDKTTMQVEAMNSGYLLKKLYPAGAQVPVVTCIGYLGEQGEAVPEGDAPAAAPAPASAPSPAAAPSGAAEDAYDVVVLGGGPAGYIAAIKAARLGAKTALVERSELGGTCLNRGCIPTKTYLKTAELLEGLSHLKARGITLADAAFDLDMGAAVSHKNQVVGQLTGGVAGLLRSSGVEVYRQGGVLRPDKTVELDDGRRLKTAKAIFAGGSKVSRIPIPGIDSPGVLTSDEMLDIDHLPDRLLVIGGGVVGVELATVFSALGSRVTILEKLDRILGGMDADLSGLLQATLEQKGIVVHTGVNLERIERGPAGLQVFTPQLGALEADTVLLSIGRAPDLSGLEGLEVTVNNGRVAVDDQMRTSLDWVWAPGDCNGRTMLAHAAMGMGEIAAENALGGCAVYSDAVIPACVYTRPEVAGVGLTEQAARLGRSVCVGTFHFSANGRALASGEPEGFVKVVADSATGELLGIHIIGPAAAELINEAAALMAMEITMFEVPDIVHAHPTFSEALMEAVADCAGNSLHKPQRKS